MACMTLFNMISNRTFWIIFMSILMTKYLIYGSMLTKNLQKSDKTGLIKANPAHVRKVSLQTEPSLSLFGKLITSKPTSSVFHTGSPSGDDQMTTKPVKYTINAISNDSSSITSHSLDDSRKTNTTSLSGMDLSENDLNNSNSVTLSVMNISGDSIKHSGSLTSPGMGLPDVKEAALTKINSSAMDFSVNNINNSSPVTSSGMNIGMNDMTSPSSLFTIRLVVLYHMVWCIQTKLVENPPLWPYDAQYVNCRSPILYSSRAMVFAPSLTWLHNYTNVNVSVSISFLGDIVWCSLHEFDEDFMFFLFGNLLKRCQRTTQRADTFIYTGITSAKPQKSREKLHVHFPTALLYHMVWCIQNNSLLLKGLPMFPQELSSCKSPLIPFNNESTQETHIAWWKTPAFKDYRMLLLVTAVVDILKCAERMIFGPDEMSHPNKIMSACEKTEDKSIVQDGIIQNMLQKEEKFKKQERDIKPVYICFGFIPLVLGSIGNVLTFVIGMRKEMRQASTGIYLSYLAIVDLLFIYLRVIPQLYIFLGNGDVMGSSGYFVCKVKFFITYYVDHLSAWIRLCFTIERMIAIVLPYIYRAHFTRVITLIILLACSLVLAGFNSYSLIVVEGQDRDEGCKIASYAGIPVFKWMDVALCTVKPFFGMIVSNSIMLYTLWRAREQRQQMTENITSIHKITIMCIASSFCFILSTAPNRLYLIANNTGLYSDPSSNDARPDVTLVLDMCRYINGTISFLVYCISGSLFRQELVRLFKKDTIINDSTGNIEME